MGVHGIAINKAFGDTLHMERQYGAAEHWPDREETEFQLVAVSFTCSMTSIFRSQFPCLYEEETKLYGLKGLFTFKSLMTL